MGTLKAHLERWLVSAALGLVIGYAASMLVGPVILMLLYSSAKSGAEQGSGIQTLMLAAYFTPHAVAIVMIAALAWSRNTTRRLGWACIALALICFVGLVFLAAFARSKMFAYVTTLAGPSPSEAWIGPFTIVVLGLPFLAFAIAFLVGGRKLLRRGRLKG